MSGDCPGRVLELTCQARPAAETIAPVQSVDDLGDLCRIEADGVEAVIWHRVMPTGVFEFLRHYPPHNVENVRICVKTAEAEDRVQSVFRNWRGMSDPVRDWLAADIAVQAQQLSAILGAPRVVVRLEVVRDDACRKFHKDWVRARLICTYSGPGTEYGEVTAAGEPPQRVRSVPTGSPILLRGKAWSSGVVDEVLHRSPPIEHSGQSRLVVVIDEASPETPEGLQADISCFV